MIVVRVSRDCCDSVSGVGPLLFRLQGMTSAIILYNTPYLLCACKDGTSVPYDSIRTLQLQVKLEVGKEKITGRSSFYPGHMPVNGEAGSVVYIRFR